MPHSKIREVLISHFSGENPFGTSETIELSTSSICTKKSSWNRRLLYKKVRGGLSGPVENTCSANWEGCQTSSRKATKWIVAQAIVSFFESCVDTICILFVQVPARHPLVGCILLGLFRQFLLWYKNNRIYGISIPERTEFVIADVTKIKAMRPRKSGYAISPQKDRRRLPKEYDYQLFCLFWTNRYSIYSINSAIRSRIDRIAFCSFRDQNRSQKNTITANSMYPYSRIVPKEHTLK